MFGSLVVKANRSLINTNKNITRVQVLGPWWLSFAPIHYQTQEWWLTLLTWLCHSDFSFTTLGGFGHACHLETGLLQLASGSSVFVCHLTLVTDFEFQCKTVFSHITLIAAFLPLASWFKKLILTYKTKNVPAHTCTFPGIYVDKCIYSLFWPMFSSRF